MKSIAKLNEFGEKVENSAFELFRSTTVRLLNGFFLFKKRKGEVVAGASTFFTLLSFGPLILLLISLLGQLFDDSSLARQFVLNGINLSFPKIDPWILRNIEYLVDAQLGAKGNKIIQILFLCVTCMGVSTTFVFGINTISKVDPDGGLIRDDLKSAIVGLFVALFLVALVVLSQRDAMIDYILDTGLGLDFLAPLIESNVFTCLMSLLFFTFFYKWSASIAVSMKDSFYGAMTFMFCFIVGKSGYWIYLKYFKEDLVSEYGHFYNFMVALIWVYFLMCAFFYGASVAYVTNKKVYSNRRRK
ncbi:YhjD/YihY/BrkB family envelope integrity protein [Halobacteriovorax sp. GB3]|uniref:YihY/virulence factor BrkB family protein n=1 Tax=Halobacteriovorax sp. GB3 TaxID=2719615 RepID=UPI002361C624|nr:YhjD/YihY/BrkB family envelope integrity protein [Halobacteriovorax sp. GB3]MDD0851867.1 YhjD/YihY/BrkB family envelope integrity protein [Halobacteriovorax sp. GB3]